MKVAYGHAMATLAPFPTIVAIEYAPVASKQLIGTVWVRNGDASISVSPHLSGSMVLTALLLAAGIAANAMPRTPKSAVLIKPTHARGARRGRLPPACRATLQSTQVESSSPMLAPATEKKKIHVSEAPVKGLPSVKEASLVVKSSVWTHLGRDRFQHSGRESEQRAQGARTCTQL